MMTDVARSMPKDGDVVLTIPNAPRADALSFVAPRKGKNSGGGFDCWCIKPTSDYELDCAAGNLLGIEFLRFIGRYPTVGNSNLLGLIVRSMAEKAAWGGHEVGFLSRVQSYVLYQAMTAVVRVNEKAKPKLDLG